MVDLSFSFSRNRKYFLLVLFLGSINIAMTSLHPFQGVFCNLGFCILNKLNYELIVVVLSIIIP